MSGVSQASQPSSGTSSPTKQGQASLRNVLQQVCATLPIRSHSMLLEMF